MSDFYKILKDTRIQRGIELEEIQTRTKINIKFLNAIENGKFDLLPEPYIRLFLRAYSTEIGLDSVKLLNQFDLMLFGGGKLTSQELKLMNLLGIETNSVKQINGNDSLLIDLYRKAETFVFPSLDEGFGIPIIESFINKCPVICSDIEIFKEIAENSVKYFNPKESLSLTDAMESVIFSPSEKNLLKERGYIQSRKYSWDKCANETISIYKKFL